MNTIVALFAFLTLIAGGGGGVRIAGGGVEIAANGVEIVVRLRVTMSG